MTLDPAPTGDTVRLLELPGEWGRAIDVAAAGSGQTCLGPAAAIQDAKHKYERALATMRDSGQTTFIFVLQPEEIARTLSPTPQFEQKRDLAGRSPEIADRLFPVDLAFKGQQVVGFHFVVIVQVGRGHMILELLERGLDALRHGGVTCM